jgi:hypothetical protein
VYQDLSIRSLVFVISQFLTVESAPVLVSDVSDTRLPGEPERKVRRQSFMRAVHDQRPSVQTLLDQLEAYRGGTLQDYLEASELVHGWLPDSEPFPSYYS